MTTLRVIATAALILCAGGCEAKSESAPTPDLPADTTEAPEPAPSAVSSGPSLNDLPVLPPPPWSAARISASMLPPIYARVWRAAENRSKCALIAPRGLNAEVAAATPRKATFSGGWAVAYDLPNDRSAFGIAGSGSNAWDADTYSQWPHNISWSDGSSAGYGPETASETNWLAYVKIKGQQCLYNVWSHRGESHLKQIIDSLRIVDSGDD